MKLYSDMNIRSSFNFFSFFFFKKQKFKLPEALEKLIYRDVSIWNSISYCAPLRYRPSLMKKQEKTFSRRKKKEAMEGVLIKLVRDFRSRGSIFIVRKHKEETFVSEGRQQNGQKFRLAISRRTVLIK